MNNVFKDANIENYTELTYIISELKDNGRLFIKNNPNLKDLEKMKLIESEIDRQLNYSIFEYRFGDCEDDRDNSYNTCDRNFAVATALAVVSGFVSLGTTTLVGEVVALLVWADCRDTAWHRYRRCIGEE